MYEEWMNKAYVIAKNNIDPIGNKGVGAIIVKNNLIIGSGCRWTFFNFLEKPHKTIHAEQFAINEAGNGCVGATLFVTMEPCIKRWHNSHNFHYDPCSDLIIKSGITRVVVGSLDENFPGKSIQYLKNNNIDVIYLNDLELDRKIKKINTNQRVEKCVLSEYKGFIDECSKIN